MKRNLIFSSYISQFATYLVYYGEFKNPQIRQTVFGKLSDINEVQDFKDGHGEGSFVIISVINKKSI